MSVKLRNSGYEVVTAMDGEEALELCLADPPDLLITDFQMPLMSGLELCKTLRAREEVARIPSIMLTARGFDIAPGEMVDAGITAVLGKPFSPRELLEKVRTLLEADRPVEAEPAADRSGSVSRVHHA